MNKHLQQKSISDRLKEARKRHDKEMAEYEGDESDNNRDLEEVKY